MKKLILIVMALLMMQTALAINCFTVVNAPRNTQNYWRIYTYDQLKDAELSNWLGHTEILTNPTGLSTGPIYNIRIDSSSCFGNYLPVQSSTTGTTSSEIILQEDTDDLRSPNIAVNKLYTQSIEEQDLVYNFVYSIRPPIQGSISYVQIPSTFTQSPHVLYDALKVSSCNANLHSNEAMQTIIHKVYDALEPGTPGCSAAHKNIVDCILEAKKGQPIHYATLVTYMARQCNIPTRIVQGISQGTFNGVDISLSNDKTHYWVEYYDQGWRSIETSENSGPNNYEYNCIDNEDGDSDSLADCFDPDCGTNYVCQSNNPYTIKFLNPESTNMAYLPNPFRIPNLTLANEYGKISWTNQKLDLRDKNVDNSVEIQLNMIEVNTAIAELNKPATITFLKTTIPDPAILQNGVACRNCTKISPTSYNIPGIGKYSLVAASTMNNTNVTAPPSPTTPTTAGDDWFGKAKTFLSNLWSSYWKQDNTTKIIIGGIVIFAIWFLFLRRRF